MKKLSWLIAFFPLFAQAQIIDFSKLATKAYVDSLYNAKYDDPTIPTLPKCDKGPFIYNITQIKQTTARIAFDADNVFGIKWVVSSLAGIGLDSGTVKPDANFFFITYKKIPVGQYNLQLFGTTCDGKSSVTGFAITSDVGVIQPPPSETKLLGVYGKQVGGREYNFNKTPEFEISITESGISDVTPGINTDRPISKLGDQNVFYAIGYMPIGGKLLNTYLPDGIYTLQQYICRADKIPDFNAFKDKYNGWNDGVNSDNARLSQIFVSIHSNTPTANSISPSWLKLSRQLNFPNVAKPKDWMPYGKHLAIGHINRQDSRSRYVSLGVQPHIDLEDGTNHAGTFWTWKKGDDSQASETDLYNWGAGAMDAMGSSPRSYLSSEIAENMQGKDDDIYGKTAAFYHGAFDKKGTKVGSWGDYGGDQYYGFIRPEFYWMSRSDYEKSLTTKIYNRYGVDGFGETSEFYTRGHVKWRGVNVKYYLWNNTFYFPLEFAYIRNRVKLGTMTYDGLNQECDVSVFTFTKTESFVSNAQGRNNAIENTSSGEVIPYQNGEIANQHMQIPAPWDEEFTLSFWSLIILNGSAMWDAPGSALGYDSTKIHFWGDKSIKWKRSGGDWDSYESGQNRAPVENYTGLMHHLYAAPQDAALAAEEVVWSIRDRIKTVSFAKYTSNIGNFTPKAGTAGLHMNGGDQPLNQNLFCERDIYEQKKGFAVDCSGPGGGVVIYMNCFLSPHEYEDNVVVNDHVIGRVYGRQTAYVTY